MKPRIESSTKQFPPRWTEKYNAMKKNLSLRKKIKTGSCSKINAIRYLDFYRAIQRRNCIHGKQRDGRDCSQKSTKTYMHVFGISFTRWRFETFGHKKRTQCTTSFSLLGSRCGFSSSWTNYREPSGSHTREEKTIVTTNRHAAIALTPPRPPSLLSTTLSRCWPFVPSLALLSRIPSSKFSLHGKTTRHVSPAPDTSDHMVARPPPPPLVAPSLMKRRPKVAGDLLLRAAIVVDTCFREYWTKWTRATVTQTVLQTLKHRCYRAACDRRRVLDRSISLAVEEVDRGSWR